MAGVFELPVLDPTEGPYVTETFPVPAAPPSIADLRGEVADQVERGAVALGLRIAEQALGAAIEVDPDRVVETVRGALRRLTERERVTILVNPEDLDAV